MNKEKITVTMALSDFDEIRAESSAFKSIRDRIAKCFYDYEYIENPAPKKCEKCYKNSCDNCKTYELYKLHEETIKVDIEQLVEVCKEYALYEKNAVDTRDLKIIIPAKTKSAKSKAESSGGKSE